MQASAPGKCILFGEHAVVYGQPAVAVAIDQRMNVKLELSEEWRIDGMIFHPERHPHVDALRQRMWNSGPPLSIKITGEIPPASGLGSSAALSVAASAALQEDAKLRMMIGRKDGLRQAQTTFTMVRGNLAKETLYCLVWQQSTKMNVQFYHTL